MDELAKRCTRCGEVKPLEQFPRHRTKPHGRNSDCLTCKRECNRRDYEVRREDPQFKIRDQERGRRYRDRLRAAVLGHYGRACACCGSEDRLTIDHVNGDGKQHRAELGGHRKTSAAMYCWLINNGFPDGFQTLCSPCNSSKKNGDRCQLDHRAAA